MRIIQHILILVLIIHIGGCKKYLDKTTDKSLTIPSKLSDYRALLDNNLMTIESSPALGETSSDNVHFAKETYENLEIYLRNSYVWAKDIFQGRDCKDWDNPYKAIYYSNVVLDGLDEQNFSSMIDEYNTIKGTALFYRAFAFYNLAQLFAKPYIAATAEADPGILLRLSSSLERSYSRSNVKATYDQILQDLNVASTLLPNDVDPKLKNRPSKPAVYALLARIYLSMNDFVNAQKYSDSALAIYSTLVDFNNIDTAPLLPFPIDNPEVIYSSSVAFYSLTRYTSDSALYNSFDEDDIRKKAFFRMGTTIFKGNYSGTFYLFNGLATDELYLIRGESRARLGNYADGIDDLNTILEKRWTKGKFVPLVANNSDEALQIILKERRKELMFRTLRWSDLRRLNQDPKYAVTLERKLNGQTFTLPPNDPRYVFPIPEKEIDLSEIPQNPR